MVRRAWHSDRLAASENVDATYDVRVGLGAVAGDKESSGEDGELSWSRYAASDDCHRLLSGRPRQRRSLGRRPSGGGSRDRYRKCGYPDPQHWRRLLKPLSQPFADWAIKASSL